MQRTISRRRHVGQQLPDRLALGLGVEIPHRVDDRGHRDVDDTLLGTEPAQLRVAGQLAPERAEIGGEIVERPADDVMTERLDRRDADLVAAADREGEAVTFDGRRRS